MQLELDTQMPEPEYRLLALDDLEPDDGLLSPPPTASMVASVQRHGVLEPILVEEPQAGDWRYTVVAGRRRVKAARAAGLVLAPAMVYQRGYLNAAQVAVAENQQRRDNPQQVLRAVLEEGRVHPTEIARTYGLPEARVLQLMELDRCLPGAFMREGVLTGKVSVSCAHRALRLEFNDAAWSWLIALLRERGSVKPADLRRCRQLHPARETPALDLEETEQPSDVTSRSEVSLAQVLAILRRYKLERTAVYQEIQALASEAISG